MAKPSLAPVETAGRSTSRSTPAWRRAAKLRERFKANQRGKGVKLSPSELSELDAYERAAGRPGVSSGGEAPAPAIAAAAPSRGSQSAPQRISAGSPKPRHAQHRGAALLELAEESFQLGAAPPVAGSTHAGTTTSPAAGGGRCPVAACGAPVRDGEKFCGSCGSRVQLAECARCNAPFGEGKFCGKCGAARPGAEGAPSPAAPGTSPAPPAPDLSSVAFWSAKKCAGVTAAINLLLAKKNLSPMDADERKELEESLAAVLNKHWRIGGAYAEEVRLGTNLLMIGFPRAYAYFVLIPEREKRTRERAGGGGGKAAGMQQRPIIDTTATVKQTTPAAAVEGTL